MGKGNNWLGVLAIVAILVAAYFYDEDRKKGKKIKELEEDNFKLILDSIQRNNDISQEIKTQLLKLIEAFKTIDIDVSNELVQALQLFQIGQVENAIEDLVKIIEHLLKKHYSTSNKFKNWLKIEKRKLDLNSLLEYCKVDKIISDIELKFFVGIKAIRNKEAHEINNNLDEYINVSGLIVGIGGIVKLARVVYPNHG